MKSIRNGLSFFSAGGFLGAGFRASSRYFAIFMYEA
jgi:hypothetical protein